MASEFAHRPALLSESLGHLNLQPGGVVVDGTIGGAGHAEAILNHTSPTGSLIGIDLDPDALEAREKCLLGSWLSISGILNVGTRLSHGIGQCNFSSMPSTGTSANSLDQVQNLRE